MRRLVMISSAAWMALCGLAATFAPQELLARAALPAAGTPLVAMQLLGALYLSFAMVNWMAKESLIGGIYNRPVALGNTLHFSMGAIALVRAAVGGFDPAVIVPLAIVYAVLALAFGTMLVTSPVAPSREPAGS
jgi:hypothetical protein